MKNISGALRIYIVLSCVWFVYFLDEISLGMCVGELHSNYEIKYNPANSFIENFISCNYLTDFISFIPIPLYFVLKWVSEGFKNK